MHHTVFERPSRAHSKSSAGEAGETIFFATLSASLGEILVAGSASGVCAIFLGDDRPRLVRDLTMHFVGAQLVEDDSSLADATTAVAAAVDDPGRPLDFPLDIRGTDFQKKVWAALRKIPPGVPTSYSEIARGIGSPKALRAVAGACAANVLALAIPCHRVLRKNGALSGYRWGMERKRALLDREKSACSNPASSQPVCDELAPDQVQLRKKPLSKRE
jgi:AraC family transcriptional regulator of adaptative response/methylated-DNA-[protein]-cysteine methyltransferase